MNMSKYIRLTKTVNDRGRLINPAELDKYITNHDVDWYTSVYYYNDEHLEYFKKNRTVTGITDVTTDNLVFDFDSKTDLVKAKEDTKELIERLKKYGATQKNVLIFFSGKKGFTVQLKLDKEMTPKEARYLAITQLGSGLETLDTTMYNANRILRVPFTKHQDTGLYKIPLTYSQLTKLTIDEIKATAKSLDNVDNYEDVTPISIPIEKVIEPIKEVAPTDFDTSKLDMVNKPPYLDKARWLIANGYFIDGERSWALLCLASTYKNVGYTKEHVYRMCKAAAELQSQRTGEARFPDAELYLNVITQVYGPNWRNGQYTTRDPENPLYKYAKKMGVLENSDKAPIRINDVEVGFIDFVTNIDKNTIKTGIAQLDKALPLTIGMNCGIVGGAGSGKTSLILDILRNTSMAGVTSVFASLDMHRIRLFEKLTYKVSRGELTRDQIYNMYRGGEGDEITDALKRDYSNVWFYDRSATTVDGIRDYVLDVENKTGEKVKLVVIDYFERIVSDMSDETAASKRVAGELQDLVNDLGVCLVVALQPNKMSLSGGPDTPILSYTAIKGSSFLYQSFRNIISIWRPFFTPTTKHNDKYMQMAILKNDLGELDTFDFRWTGKTGEITDLSDYERTELERLLDEKEANNEDDWRD